MDRIQYFTAQTEKKAHKIINTYIHIGKFLGNYRELRRKFKTENANKYFLLCIHTNTHKQ